MEYFLSHIGYVVVVGVVVAALGIVMVVCATLSRKESEKHPYDPELDKSDLMCAGCKMVSMCGMSSSEKKDCNESPELAVEKLVAEIKAEADKKSE